jgi:hypothetical protein
VTLQFRIYDAQTGGNLVDMNGDGSVDPNVGRDVKEVSTTAMSGLVSTKFGPVSPKAFNGSARWLEVRVNGAVLSRTEVAGAAATAEQVNKPSSGAPAISIDGEQHVIFHGMNDNMKVRVGRDGCLNLYSDRDNGPAITMINKGPYSQQYGDAAIFIVDEQDQTHNFIMVWRDGELKFQNNYCTPMRIGRSVVEMRVVQITGGSDLAEPFGVAKSKDGEQKIDPGMVVVIDPDNPGQLKLASEPYDRKVAGILSGANGLKPGMVMKSEGDKHADGEHPVALTGRVWCWCDTKYGPITPGDRLTTSATPGHAMKAAEESKSAGAVIGKAMTKLETGKGLVLVLVQPQ